MKNVLALLCAILLVGIDTSAIWAQRDEAVEIQTAAVKQIASRKGNPARVVIDRSVLQLETSAHAASSSDHSQRLLDVAQNSLKWRVARYRDAVKCESQKAPRCRLVDNDLYISVSAVRMIGETAEVDVYAFAASESKRDPIYREGFLVVLKRDRNSWIVDRVKSTWQS